MPLISKYIGITMIIQTNLYCFAIYLHFKALRKTNQWI